jgi:hypothetical protein
MPYVLVRVVLELLKFAFASAALPRRPARANSAARQSELDGRQASAASSARWLDVTSTARTMRGSSVTGCRSRAGVPTA